MNMQSNLLQNEERPIFSFQNAYTKDYKAIYNIESFSINVLNQTGNLSGFRRVTDGILFNDKELDNTIAIPYWENSSIVGFVMLTKKPFTVGRETPLLGVNLQAIKDKIIATDDMHSLRLLSDMGHPAVYNRNIQNAVNIINDYAPSDIKRLAISSNAVDGFSDWLIKPQDDEERLKYAIIERLRQIKPNKKTLDIICMSDVKIEPIAWLWHNWLPIGKLTLLAGVGGCGKTNLALSIASTITRGGTFPDGTKCDYQGKILIYSTEDDPNDVLAPRLLANGANMDNVFMLRGRISEHGEHEAFSAETDLPLLIDAVQKLTDLRLIIIDPIVSFINGDTSDNAKVRNGLEPLVKIAMQNKIAILGITHFSKNSTGGRIANRVMGAQAFTAVSRMTWVASKKEGENEGILAIAKTNITTDDRGIKYRLEQIEVAPNIHSTKIDWLEVVTGNSSNLIAEYDKPLEFDNALDEAKFFLSNLLTDNLRMTFKEVKAQADDQGISKATLDRAKVALEIKSQLAYENGTRAWYWSLPVKNRLDEPPF